MPSLPSYPPHPPTHPPPRTLPPPNHPPPPPLFGFESRTPAGGQEQGQEQEVPEIGALFDDVDPTKFEKEAFDLFRTVEVSITGTLLS